jgi:hypothetical protein
VRIAPCIQPEEGIQFVSRQRGGEDPCDFSLRSRCLRVWLLTTTLRAQSITNVEPLAAKAGDTVSAKGEGIDSSKVDTLYLTDGTHDLKCESRRRPPSSSRCPT